MNSLLQNSDLKLKKVGKATRPLRYDLNQIPYDYPLKVTNRFKGLDLIEFHKNYGQREAVLRWRRNKMGKSLSPPQIHQKIIWTLSKYHKTTSERLQRTPGSQKGSLWKQVGQNIKDKKTKEWGMETCPREGVIKEEKFPNTRKTSHWLVCGEFWNLRGRHNWEEKVNK